MSEYDDVVETALMEEEQIIESEEHGPGSAAGHRFVPLYITGISLLVAVAALATAFAADHWMEDTLDRVADRVDYYTLRVEHQCQEIQRSIAELQGVTADPAWAQNFENQYQRTSAEMAAVTGDGHRVTRDAQRTDRAHYTLAIAITFLQMASALAAIMSTMRRPQLIYASIAFASVGLVLTAVGLVRFLT